MPWQLSQRFVAMMCVGFLPVAAVPLWQPEQPLVMPACVKLAGVQASVVWQVSQPVGHRNVRGAASLCGRAVVAARAAALDLRVIDAQRRTPGSGGMAGFADQRRGDVGGGLAGRGGAVVAARAAAHDPGVIEPAGAPGRRRMAALAAVVGRDVRCGLAGRGRAVVAGEAAALHLVVIDARHRLPAADRVAGLATIGRGDV